PPDRIAIEKFQALKIRHLLPAIDQGKSIPGGAKYPEGLCRIAHPLVLAAAVRILIMVRRKVGPHRSRRELPVILPENFVKPVKAALFSPDRFHPVQELPGIGGVEYFMISDFLAFRQPEHTFYRLERRSCL